MLSPLSQDFLARIDDALKQNRNDEILQFGDYRITEERGGGQQGRVLKLENRIGKIFALKLFHPTDTESSIVSNARKNFNREIEILSKLSHRNIVGIINAGTAHWIDTDKHWDIIYGLGDSKSSGQEMLFYIADFIEGDDLSSVFPEVYSFQWERIRGEDNGKLLAFAEEKLHMKNITGLEKVDNKIELRSPDKIVTIHLTEPRAILEIDGHPDPVWEFGVSKRDGNLELTPKKKGVRSSAKGVATTDKLTRFESFASQILDAIGFYHKKTSVAHMDIKPANIIFRPQDSAFVLVDFGFAHRYSPFHFYPVAVMTRYLDSVAIKASDYQKSDIGQVAQIFQEILPSLKSDYDSNKYEGISHALDRALDGDLTKRYTDAYELKDTLEQYFLTSPRWKFSLGLNEHLCPGSFGRFTMKMRLPVNGSILLTEEVRHIVDSREFQRLRGVRQLGPTYFVFPGASHTRFEHSLGAYFLTLKYIERLIGLSAFRELGKPIDETIKLMVLCSLLHDIGHYPYSHWIEEIDMNTGTSQFPDHEDRARAILVDGEIAKLIRNEWSIEPKIVADIIATKHIGPEKLLLNSIINSVIDVDKVDYLIRDSIHCGVPYGLGIDVDRLLDSLWIDREAKKICLTEKGKSCVLSILACRNIMYQEVYWHKTVRACHAMFKRFFYEFVNSNVAGAEDIAEYFNYTDDPFAKTLYAKSPNDKMKGLIAPFVFEGRRLYKPAYIYHYGASFHEHQDTKNFFLKVLRSPFSGMVKMSNALTEKLKPRIHELEALDILIDKTPIKEDHEKYILNDFQIFNTKKSQYEKSAPDLNGLNEYLDDNKKAYIFCNPKYYEELRKLAKSGELNSILGSIA